MNSTAFVNPKQYGSNLANIRWTNLGFVEVTSPEQYVPLCLVHMLPGTLTSGFAEAVASHRWYVGNTELQLNFDDYKRLSETPSEQSLAYKNTLREILGEILNQPLIKSYRIPVGDVQCGPNEENLIDMFLGSAMGGAPTTLWGSDIIGLGLLGKYYGRITPREDNPYYGIAPVYSGNGDIEVEALMLVKAKKINYLRACIMLQMPQSLNYGDIRIIRGPSLASTRTGMTIDTELRTRADNFGIQVENMSNVDLKKFITTANEDKDKFTYLADAKQALVDPRLDVVLT